MPFENHKRFEVTEDHMKLLPHLYFNYNEWTEFGAPEVDPKRPYGNSDVYSDLGEHLGLSPEGDDGYGDGEWTKEQKEHLFDIHKSMTTVLNILVSVAVDGISPGWYTTSSSYGNDWKRESNG